MSTDIGKRDCIYHFFRERLTKAGQKIYYATAINLGCKAYFTFYKQQYGTKTLKIVNITSNRVTYNIIREKNIKYFSDDEWQTIISNVKTVANPQEMLKTPIRHY